MLIVCQVFYFVCVEIPNFLEIYVKIYSGAHLLKHAMIFFNEIIEYDIKNEERRSLKKDN